MKLILVLTFFLSISAVGHAKEIKKEKFNCTKCGTNEECLLSCFVTCERWGGWSTNGIVRKCEKCMGKVITVVDQGPADGMTIRVCDGKMTE